MPVIYGNTGADRLSRPLRPETERQPGSLSPRRSRHGLWATSCPTAALLHRLSDELSLNWTLNATARPELLVLTNLGRFDPAKLIARCRPGRVALCLDDRAGRRFLEQTDLPCFTYSEGRDEADLTAHDLRILPSGLTFLAVTQTELARVSTPTGDLYCALAALASACALGIPLTRSAPAVSRLLCAPSDPCVL